MSDSPTDSASGGSSAPSLSDGAAGESSVGSPTVRAPVLPMGETVRDPAFATARVVLRGPESTLAGKRFGKYRILREVGRGGMGVVYEALDDQLARSVALKVLGGGPDVQAEDRERFLREARICAQMAHTGIVAVHDVGEELGQPYFTMDLVRGCSLADWVNLRPLEIRESVQAIRDIARAIAHAHGLGVVHRDLKPSNVLCEWPGGLVPAAISGEKPPFPRVMVTDFGLGKVMDSPAGSALTVTGTVLGTPAYMPPEQAAGKTSEIAPWSDVYSLGAMLYELVTGAPPFQGSTPYEICAKVLRDYPRSPRSLNGRLSRDLETVIAKAMEKDPRRRYPTARELLEDLERFLGGEAILARPMGWSERLWRLARRDPRAAVLLSLAVLAPAAVAVALFFTVRTFTHLHDQAALPYWLAQRATAEARPMVEVYPLYRESLLIDPDNWDAQVGLAEIHLELGQFGEALRRSALAAGASENVPTPHLQCGLAELELGGADRARERLTHLPKGERDAPSRWYAHAVVAWMDDPEVRPPQRGFRWPPTAAALAADSASRKKLRESVVWSEIAATQKLREPYPVALLLMNALARDGEREAVREILERLRRTHPGRPPVLAWTAWLDGGDYAGAIAEADRPELHLLAADAARRAGNAPAAEEHRKRSAADAQAREQAATGEDEKAYWRAIREEAEAGG